MTSIGLASGWDFNSKKQQSAVSGCAVTRYVGGRYRIRTCDFHRVNYEVVNLKPFAHFAFPYTATLKNTKSGAVLVTNLVTSFSAYRSELVESLIPFARKDHKE